MRSQEAVMVAIDHFIKRRTSARAFPFYSFSLCVSPLLTPGSLLPLFTPTGQSVDQDWVLHGGNFMSMAAGNSMLLYPPLDFQKPPEGTDPISKLLSVPHSPVNAKILRFQLGLVKDTLLDILRDLSRPFVFGNCAVRTKRCSTSICSSRHVSGKWPSFDLPRNKQPLVNKHRLNSYAW